MEVTGQVLRAFMPTIFLSKVEPGKESEITTLNSVHLLSYLLYAYCVLATFSNASHINSFTITGAL